MHSFVFLVRLQIAVADAFKTKYPGQLFLLALTRKRRRSLVGRFCIAETIHAEISAAEQVKRLKRTRAHFSRRLQIRLGFLKTLVNDQEAAHQNQRRRIARVERSEEHT